VFFNVAKINDFYSHVKKLISILIVFIYVFNYSFLNFNNRYINNRNKIGLTIGKKSFFTIVAMKE